MTLVNTRQKLAPFVDDGFAHENRAKKKKIVVPLVVDRTEKRIDATLELLVSDYRSKIKAHMRDREYHELDQLLNPLTTKLGDSRYDNELTKELRLDVIHGQICLANYHEWRQS